VPRLTVGAALRRTRGEHRQIAAVLKITESRVCQLHSQSIARLRAKLRAW
jgi:DNA-directed RNA polymerase specialized sigma subunit